HGCTGYTELVFDLLEIFPGRTVEGGVSALLTEHVELRPPRPSGSAQPGCCQEFLSDSCSVVVERWWQVPLSKMGKPARLHPRRHRIYKLVEDTKNTPNKKMELILTQTVPKLGGRGETVFVKKSFGRNKLLLEGLAVYPSPENKQMFAEELRVCSVFLQTVDFLKRSQLKINKMPSEEFQLTKEVVCRQLLKKLGVVVPLQALTLPFEPIKEVGDYWCEVTVRNVLFYLHHLHVAQSNRCLFSRLSFRCNLKCC
uniref:Large ribosomal subunit protein bL9m n=1 Tax=Lates calcarifer TaxID=8187 RepID=A0A4W6CEI7_LATCA